MILMIFVNRRVQIYGYLDSSIIPVLLFIRRKYELISLCARREL